MKFTVRVLLAAALLLPGAAAFAQSTVNPNVPAQNSDLTSSVVRGNFAATYNDITSILGVSPRTTAPSSPVVGQLWRKTNVSPQTISQWTGSVWAQVSTFNTSTGKITPYFGDSLLAWQQLMTGTGGLGTNGQCITSTGPTTVPTAQSCVSGATVSATSPLTWNSGTLTMACPTCATTTSGGAITGTPPVTVSAGGAISINNNGITNALLRQGVARSVIGVTGGSTANVADIQATSASDAVLRESGGALAFGTVATAGIANNAVTLAKLATQATNTVLANVTSGSAVPTAFAVGSCDTATKALGWTTDTGFVCNSAITAAAVPASGLTGTTLAASVVTSSLTTVGALGAGSATTGFTINAANVTWSGVIPGVSVATVANASGAPSATFGVMKCDGTTTTCTSGVVTAVGGVATSVQIGATTITAGTTTRVLYDNAGVLGEYTVSGSGNVCMTTSCVMTTPNLGTPSAATLTSATGLPISSGVTGLGTGVATALAVNTASVGSFAVTVASGAKALATSAISSATCSSAQTDTATGAATTDVVDAAFNADPTAVTGYTPSTSGMLTIIAYATSNTVNFKVCNNTSSSITPGAITLNWRVRR